MEIWIPVIVAVVSSVFTYFAAVRKGKSDLKALKMQHESDMEAFREKHKLDIERLEREQKHELDKIASSVSSEAKLYEEKVQTDFAADVMKKMFGEGSLDDLLNQVINNSPKA